MAKFPSTIDMELSWVSGILRLPLTVITGVLYYLLSSLFILVYWVASPLIYLSHGLLVLVFSPLRLLIKLEVDFPSICCLSVTSFGIIVSWLTRS